MTWSWQTPRKMDDDGVETENPYVHWWNTREKSDRESLENSLVRLNSLPIPKYNEILDDTETQFGGTDQIPLSKSSANPDMHDDWAAETISDRLPCVDDDTIILGIVDTGIALGHRRFRGLKGETRVISSWQQDARFAEQADLPCGEELFGPEIDDLIVAHSQRGAATGDLDEETFNRAAGLVDPLNPIGQRDLDRAGAHGTHVLDLAAGFAPDPENAEAIRRQKIIAVNLPAQHAHGTAGNFLAYFAVTAVARILFVADALWGKSSAKNGSQGKAGFPIVINFSYGMQAGPKDGSLFFERMIRALLRHREKLGMTSPVRIVMPVGNDNLERGHAKAVLGQKGAIGSWPYPAQPRVEIPWRILPADGTANFTEIWFEAQATKEDCVALAQDLQIHIAPPRSPSFPVPKVSEQQYSDLIPSATASESVARVYSRIQPGDDGWRLSFLVCVSPTQDPEGRGRQAPAGLWTLAVEAHRDPPVAVSFYIQSDQSWVRGSKQAQRSYFDHSNYKVHLETGRKRDAFHYELGHFAKVEEPWEEQGPVQRRGSHNAVATLSLPEICCIGSYRDSDGRPTLYSAATDGGTGSTSGRAMVSAAYPGETAGSLYGLLASGARDGSVKAFRGTSMSTGLASRDILQAFQDASSDADLAAIGTETWLINRAAAHERKIGKGLLDRWGQDMTWGVGAPQKTGAGRLPMPTSWRRSRIDR